MAGRGRMLWGLGVVGCLGPNPAFDDVRATDGATGSGSVSASMSTSTSTSATASSVTAATMSAEGSESSAADPTSDASAETSGGPIDESCDAGDPDLVLCYDFESREGDVLLDGSMYGHDASCTGLSLTPSPWGRAIATTSDSHIEVACFEECEATDALTLEARVRLDEEPNPGQRVGVVDNDLEYAITYSRNDGLRCSTGGAELTGPELPLGEWVYVACTYDGADIRAYLDGVEVARVGANNPVGSGDGDPVAVANTAPDWNEPFIGALDRLRVWRRARTPEEICDEAGC